MSHSRMQLLLEVLGGEANLPSKLPPPPEPVQEEDDNEEPPPIIRPPNYKPPTLLQPIIQPKVASAASMETEGADHTALDPEKGCPSPLGLTWVPFPALAKYPYKFVPKRWMQPLATAFFDNDKIYNREWHLYFIHAPEYPLLTFVPEHEFQSLIDEINAAFPSANLSIGEYERDNGLVVDFEDLSQRFRPRYLGRCTSRHQFNSWVHQVECEPAIMMPDGSDRSLEAFKEKIEAAYQAGRNKTKAAKQKRHQETVVKRQDMVRQSLRTQRYLGLLPKKSQDEDLLIDIANLSVEPVDATQPPPHPFDDEPIFIAVDVEAYEKPPRMVTEVGVATLDTRDLKGAAPGRVGADWHKFIRGRHFRIIEYKSLVNQEYVQGCPDQFEFGQSEFVAKASIGSKLSSCFREPFSGSGDATSTGGEEAEKRNLIIVGHDLNQDIAYCQSIGVSLLNRGNIIDKVDTVNMFRAYTKDPNARSLGSILSECDLTGWHLHNAGNDAVYTVQAMLALAVKTATERGSEEAEKKESLEKRAEELVENAKERAKDDSEGWSSVDGDDGGVSLRPQDEDSRPKRKGPAGSGPFSSNGLYTLAGSPLDV